MTLYFEHNLYRGVNAHLHSDFQANGDGIGFHSSYIVLLARTISEILPSQYMIDIVKSMQLKTFHPDTGEPLVYFRQKRNHNHPTKGIRLSDSNVVSWIYPLNETFVFSEDCFLSAILIYKRDSSTFFGKPITQLELLLPSGKLSGDGYLQYHEKRQLLLERGLQLIEIDLFHGTDSPIGGIPSYTARESNASPYYIAMNIPIPDIKNGKIKVYGFGVDQPIPSLDIPLNSINTITVDFDAPYQKAFQFTKAYSLRSDYSQPPLNFDRYTKADQARILAVMERAKLEAAKE